MEELEEAFRMITGTAQWEAHPESGEKLQSSKQLSDTDPLCSLYLFLDESGLMGRSTRSIKFTTRRQTANYSSLRTLHNETTTRLASPGTLAYRAASIIDDGKIAFLAN